MIEPAGPGTLRQIAKLATNPSIVAAATMMIGHPRQECGPKTQMDIGSFPQVYQA